MTRIAVVGTGAIGATVAAALQEAGHRDLVLCGRTPRERIVVEPEGGEPIVLDSPLLTDPADAGGPADWVLLAVKVHQTEGAAPWLAALAGPGTVVVVLQNGVEHRELVQPHAPDARILPAVVWVPAEAIAPGRVRRRGEVHLVVPDGDDGRALVALLGGHARVDRSGDFATAAWMKLATNAVAGLMVLSGRRAGMFRRADVAALARAYADEVLRVARAEGANPGTADDVMAGYASMPDDLGSSILFDREAGRALEWDARNGVVQRRGSRHGIATPISDVVVPLLAAASDG
jgi:2-dehydropantoate 2-reductase